MIIEKVIFSIIFILTVSSGFTITANAQSLYVDAHLEDMSKIDESKYIASALTETRNPQGDLISVVRTDASRYLNDPVVDKFLNSDPDYLIKEGKIKNENVKMYQVQVGYYNPECLENVLDIPGQYDRCNWYYRAFVTMLGISDEKGERWDIFRGLNHTYTIKGLDDITSFWTVLVRD